MRTLEYKSEFKQKENALETIEIFSPLAYYLGAYQIKSELEDLSLYYLRRDVYDNIAIVLDEIRDDVDKVIYECLEKLGNVLADNNIPFEHKELVKSIYVLYKQVNKVRKIVDIHDLVAIKLIVNDINDCFRILDYVHSTYPPKGRTPIGFAYKLHTGIGNTMVAAIVNDEMVNVDYTLQRPC